MGALLKINVTIKSLILLYNSLSKLTFGYNKANNLNLMKFGGSLGNDPRKLPS
jgi:hypothetical protein